MLDYITAASRFKDQTGHEPPHLKHFFEVMEAEAYDLKFYTPWRHSRHATRQKAAVDRMARWFTQADSLRGQLTAGRVMTLLQIVCPAQFWAELEAARMRRGR